TMTDPKDDHDNLSDPTETNPQGDQPQTDSDPQPTPTAHAALAQSFASGRGQAQAQAQVIAELCLIAGQSQRTAEFLTAGFSETQVRRALLDARADQPEIASRITADAGSSQRPENSPVVAAVKKLNAKE
ncbi:MAG: S49 family peptidase, partial [Burkholderiales bacterium]